MFLKYGTIVCKNFSRINITRTDLLLRNILRNDRIKQRDFVGFIQKNLQNQNQNQIYFNLKGMLKLLRRKLHTTTRKNFVEKDVITGQKSKNVKMKRGDVARLFNLAKSEKLIIAAAIGCLIISSSITMSVPLALGKILDIIFAKTESLEDISARLKGFSLFLCGVFLLGGLANFGRIYLFNTASLRIIKNIRTQLYNRMLLQETSWYDTRGTGELVNRLAADAYLVGSSLSKNVSDGLRSTVMIVAGTSMMFYTSPELAFVSVAIVPCVASLAIFYGSYIRDITKKFLGQLANTTKFAEERLGNIKTVKIFCKEKQEGDNYSKLLDDVLITGYKEVLARAAFFGMTGFSGNLILVSVLYYGGSLVSADKLTVGALTSFVLYAGYSIISLNGLSTFYSELNKGIGSAQNIWEILDRKYEMPINKGLIMEKPVGKISFENVYFNFPTRNSDTLQNFNLVLMPGETTAVVGRSGAGKSTIGLLLLRLYDPRTGGVYLDGKNLKDLNPTWLRSRIGTVNQEPILFSGTIRENILYGLNPNTVITDSELQNVVRKAYIQEFLESLPNGLDSIVGERGIMLSVGQKQRVAIARALIRNPPILLFDEATSALDSASEEMIQNALEQLAEGRTVLTIAHRLSTVRNANKIVVLDGGDIQEQGTYQELISKNNGYFKELVKKQTLMA